MVRSRLARYAGGVSEGGEVVCGIWAFECGLIIIVGVIVVIIICGGDGGLVLVLLSGVGINVVRS